MLKHIVFMKFKPETSDEDIADLEKGLRGLPALVPEIRGYELGRDILHTERSFDFALVSAFDDLEAMKRYQTNPDHMVVAKKVQKLSEKILAVDFEY